MSTDVRELPGARWVTHGTRLLAGLYVWLCAWLALWVLVPALFAPWTPTVVASGSMGPAINRGDVVLVTSADLDDVGAGHVVTFHRDGRPDGELVTHRVYAVDGDGRMTTKGDANATSDSVAIDRDALVGRGRLLVPYVGLPLLWLRESPLVFLAWAVLTAVAVALARAGLPKVDDLVDEDGQPVFAPGEGWWGPLDRVLGILEGPPRPPAGPVRAWTPSVAVTLALVVLVRDWWGLVLAVLTVVGVLLADPRGPHLPVGRLVSAVGSMRDDVGERMLPRVREQGMYAMLPLVAAVGIGMAALPSHATFTDTVAAPGSRIGAGIWECVAPGPESRAVVADGWAGELLPDATNAVGPTLLVDGDRPRTRAYLEVDLAPPIGCALVGAELVLDVAQLTGPPEELRVRAVTSPFDGEAVTWASRPPTGGDHRVSAGPGEVRVDVTALVLAGGHGFELSVLDEDADDDGDDGDVGALRVSSIEGSAPPRLELTWGELP